MRGFVCGLIVSVGFILGTGRAWRNALPTTQPARAGQPQIAPQESPAEPHDRQQPTKLQPQMASELLELRQQLGGAWKSGQEGDAAFLEALKQVAEEETKPPPVAAPTHLNHSPIKQQMFERLSNICQSLHQLEQELQTQGQTEAATRLRAFETLLRGEAEQLALTPNR